MDYGPWVLTLVSPGPGRNADSEVPAQPLCWGTLSPAPGGFLCLGSRSCPEFVHSTPRNPPKLAYVEGLVGIQNTSNPAREDALVKYSKSKNDQRNEMGRKILARRKGPCCEVGFALYI